MMSGLLPQPVWDPATVQERVPPFRTRPALRDIPCLRCQACPFPASASKRITSFGARPRRLRRLPAFSCMNTPWSFHRMFFPRASWRQTLWAGWTASLPIRTVAARARSPMPQRWQAGDTPRCSHFFPATAVPARNRVAGCGFCREFSQGHHADHGLVLKGFARSSM